MPTNRLIIGLCCLVHIILVLTAAPVFGEEPDNGYGLSNPLELASEEPALPARYSRPASKIAENITVISADDISRLNAHTLADVLQTVPGVQLDQLQTPGSWTFFNILGATSRHILVQIDGVPQNFLSSDNQSEIGAIPVQMIDRVEIVKGAASATWGSALGGVVNVITKAPTLDRTMSGMASGSAGERDTSDLRGELSGTVQRFGYYLTGGKLRSAGLVQGNRVNLNHGFGKLVYEMPQGGSLTLGADVRETLRGLEDSVPLDFHDNGGFRTVSGYLAYRQPLAERLSLDVNARGGVRDISTRWGALTVPDLFLDASNREAHEGVTLGLNWGDALNNLSTGIEYEHDDVRGRELVGLAPENNFDLTLDRWSAFANGSWSLGRFSLLPGVRYTHTSLLEDSVSYTLGATVRLNDATAVRLYAARGYSMPVINNLAIRNGQRQLQNIWTVQAGVETASLPYLWLKATLFYNNIWNIQDIDASTIPATITLREQIRQGTDLELRTTSWHGLALDAGYTFTDAYDKATGASLSSNESGPRHNAKVAVNYDNVPLGLTATLTGNYAFWKTTAQDTAKFGAPIWDLHVTQRLLPRNELSPELFLSAHNIFNGEQYLFDFRPNAPRWFEGGLRVRF